MFLLRLKTEFSENLKLVIALWITLGVIAWSFYQWWFGPLVVQQTNEGALSGITVLFIGVICFALISTMFKRDDLKHPEDFWATRPIRAWTFFGTKFVFAFLTIILPMGVLMTVLGLVAGVGVSAVWHGLEMMLWIGVLTILAALSVMAYPGGNRALLGLLCYFGGVILTCIILSNGPSERILRPYWMNEHQRQWNLLVTLLLLAAVFSWQCLRQIRDKHLRQRPLVWIATGILTVLLVTFVPLPGGLPDRSISSSATTLPIVTKAKVHPTITFGKKHDAEFISHDIELIPEQKLVGQSFDIVGANLMFTGSSTVPQQVDISHVALTHPASSRQMVEARPVLSYYVFDRPPGYSSSSSSGSDSGRSEIIASLPRQKIRIHGTVNINQITYRTIHRGPLTQPFEMNKQGMKFAFHPTPNRHTEHDSSALWKSYSPPFVTARSSNRWDPVRFRLEHSGSTGLDWYNQLEGGGSGGSSFFGPYRDNELRISDQNIEFTSFWRQLQESGYKKTVQEWKQEAELICEVIDQIQPLTLPVDIEVEVADPEKVHELLKKGAL